MVQLEIMCNHCQKCCINKYKKYAIVFASKQLRIARLGKCPIDPKAYLGRCSFNAKPLSKIFSVLPCYSSTLQLKANLHQSPIKYEFDPLYIQYRHIEHVHEGVWLKFFFTK